MNIFLTFKAIFKSLWHLRYTPGGTALTAPTSHGARWAGFPGADFGILLSPLLEHSRMPGYPISIDTVGDTCGEEPEQREEVVIKGRKSGSSPTKESRLLYLAGLAEGRGRGLWGRLLS